MRSYSPRPSVLITEAKLFLRLGQRNIADDQLKSDVDGIVTQLDRLIQRSSVTDQDEQQS